MARSVFNKIATVGFLAAVTASAMYLDFMITGGATTAFTTAMSYCLKGTAGVAAIAAVHEAFKKPSGPRFS